MSTMPPPKISFHKDIDVPMALPNPINPLRIKVQKDKELLNERGKKWAELNKKQSRLKRLFSTSPVRRKNNNL